LVEDLVNATDLREFLIEFDKPENRTKYGFVDSIFADADLATACFGRDTRSTGPMLA